MVLKSRNINSEVSLDLLQKVIQQQQILDRAFVRYTVAVRQYLHQTYPERWTRRRGAIE